ncbi:MAG: hypothetical protein QNJ98_14795 [Planctomycetota bacterium]|nr:hypothetical protein [Planctomycetota bacterium]
MSRYAALLVALLLLAGCGDDAPKPQGKRLRPDAAKSFVTPTARTLIGILGPGWALRIRLEEDAFPYHDAEMPLERRVWSPDAMLIRGPELTKYVRPPSGVPAMPIPSGKGHRIFIVQDLWVRIAADKRLPEPDGYVDVTIEPFTADGFRYVVPDTLQLQLKGPYP